jgi:hypothetical protein
VALDGDRLRLTAPALDVSGQPAVPVLTWRRSAAAEAPSAAALAEGTG